MKRTHDFLVHYEGHVYAVKNIDVQDFCFLDMVKEVISVVPGLMENCVSAKIASGIPGKEHKWKVYNDGSLRDMFDMYHDVKEINIFLTHVQKLSQELCCEALIQKIREGERHTTNEKRDEEEQHEKIHMDDDNEFNDDSDDSFMMNENDDNVETDGMTSTSDEDAEIGDESSDEHSEGSESSEGGVPFVCGIVGPKRWTRDTGEKIVLEKDIVFLDITEFRNVLRDYAIQEGFELYRQKNEKTRVTAICAADNCPWRIHASLGKDKSSFIIKSLNPKHTCLRTGNKCDATSGWIARQMIEELSADFKMGYDLMYQQMNSKFGIDPSRSRLYRAKKKAKNMIEGTHEDAYSLLPAYAEVIREHNPGSIFKIQYYEGSETMPPRFKRAFLCLEACKTGFIKGCRPFLGLDGCHLKGQFGGVLLAAIGVDGNGGQFPLACAIVEKENNSSWHWFLERLEEVLGSNYEGFAFTIMSDRQKGLSQMVVEVFPMAQHRNCCVHLAKNFKAKFPQVILSVDLWDAARAYTKQEFNIAMRKLASHNEDASSWLSKIPMHQWARHAFNTICKVDHMTNNNAESFNSWIDKLRSKPIIQLFERLRMKLMSRFHERYQRGCSWRDQVCENVRKELDKIVFEARHCKCSPAGKGEFQVKDGNKNFMVNLESRSCNCLIWEHSGLPCKHAVVCIIYIRANIEDYVNEYFFKEKYLAAYENIIHPQPDISTIEVSHRVYPPFLARLPGRPRVNRRLEANDSRCGSSTRKHRTLRCTNCDQLGHNTRTCQRAPVRDKRVKKRQTREGTSQASSPNISAQEKVLQKRMRRNEKKRMACGNQRSNEDGIHASQESQSSPHIREQTRLNSSALQKNHMAPISTISEGPVLFQGSTRFGIGGTFERKTIQVVSGDRGGPSDHGNHSGHY